MLTALGGVLGCVLGACAWRVVAWYAARTPAPGPSAPADSGPGPRPRADRFLPTGLGAVVSLGLAGAVLGWWIGSAPQLLVGLAFTTILLALSWTDYRTRRLPNPLLLALLALAVVQSIWLGRPSLMSAGLALLAGGALFLLLALLRRGAMGAGDVKLAAALGAFLGFPAVLPALLFGAVAGGLAALVLLATRRAGRRDYMAYGPYLALGAWIVWMRAASFWS